LGEGLFGGPGEGRSLLVKPAILAHH